MNAFVFLLSLKSCFILSSISKHTVFDQFLGSDATFPQVKSIYLHENRLLKYDKVSNNSTYHDRSSSNYHRRTRKHEMNLDSHVIDHAVYQLETGDSNHFHKLDYMDLSSEILEDHRLLVNFYEDIENSESHESRGRFERSQKIFKQFEYENHWLESGDKKSKFDEYFKNYKLKRAAMETDPEIKKMQKYIQRMRKNDPDNEKAQIRKPR